MKAQFFTEYRDGRNVVVRSLINGNELRENVVWTGDPADEDDQTAIDLAEEEREGYEEGWYAEQDARRAGDDPRFEPPDDPYAYQNEQLEQYLDFLRHENDV